MKYNKKLSVQLRLSEYLFDSRKLDVNYSIARVMLSKIGNIHDITIEEIAYCAHTSPSSVTKFCKGLGYASFKSLKADQSQFEYADAFQDMVLISNTRGIDAAFHFFVEEHKKKMLEIFRFFEHQQISRIAQQLNKAKSGAVFSGIHGFASSNFFLEAASYYDISLCEINRTADTSMIQTIMETENIIFIISLTGAWMDYLINEVEIKPDLVEKIVLITYEDSEKYKNYCKEIVSCKDIREFFSSNYYSSTAMSMLFLLFVLSINEKGI